MSNHHTAKRPRHAHNCVNEDRIIAEVKKDLQKSIRRIARQFDLSLDTIQRTLWSESYHSYQYNRTHTLTPQDLQSRLNFCNWVLTRARNHNFLRNILFTGECTFARSSCRNSYNLSYYAYKNTFSATVQNSQDRFLLNLWVGIIGDRLVGPFQFDGNLTGELYATFLNQCLHPLCLRAGINRAELNRIWYQHNRHPAHTSLVAKSWLRQNFRGRFIGKSGSKKWPARSPDLNPVDFFLWDFVKSVVYREFVNSLQELEQRIQDAIRQITPEMLQSCTQSLVRRAECCVQMNGGLFEHLIH
ncbi:uncharacterized protein [Chelonus insularis]|uniref:uncharacterized protein n=1 Tax=Chelonus insularis TaxID=460826 RepID=UPI00158EFB55|nr:uncharacterized protein LOC118067099 [Chelonus insularis]